MNLHKNKLSIIFSLLLSVCFSITVYSHTWCEYTPSNSVEEIIPLIREHIIDDGKDFYYVDSYEKIMGKLENMFGDLSKHEIEYSVRKEPLDDTNHIYYRSAEIKDIGVEFVSIIETNRLSRGFVHYQTFQIGINQDALKLMSSDIIDYFSKISKLDDLLKLYEETLWSSQYIDFEMLKSGGGIDLNNINGDIKNGFQFSEYIDVYVTQLDDDSPYTDWTYMIEPHKVNFDFTAGYRTYIECDSEQYMIRFYYAPPESVNEGDYRNYELQKVTFDLNYKKMEDINDVYDSPQTGTPIVPLAITAAVAFAVTVVIQKKKRVKYIH